MILSHRNTETHDTDTRTQCRELLVVACFYPKRKKRKNKSLNIKAENRWFGREVTKGVRK